MIDFSVFAFESGRIIGPIIIGLIGYYFINKLVKKYWPAKADQKKH